MSEETTTETVEKNEDTVTDTVAKHETNDDGVNALVSVLEKTAEVTAKLPEEMKEMRQLLEKAAEPQFPNGKPWGAPNLRKGEDSMTSRPYSYLKLAQALTKRNNHEENWKHYASVEMELSDELRKAYYAMGKDFKICAPIGADYMPTEETELIDGTKLPGVPVETVNKCRELTSHSTAGFDLDEFAYLAKRGLFPNIRKDMSANIATAGGTMRALAAEGELIDLFRGKEVFSRAGARSIGLPPQGSIRFPRVTGGITIGAFAEGQTITESTPGTGALTLEPKAYSGFVDIPEELLKFATSVSVEVWLRGEMAKDMTLQEDSDMIQGAGGTAIQGIINYAGVRLVVAGTTGANGDTLDPPDPIRLHADIADQDAPVDDGFFYALTNTLWGGISTRQATTNEFIFSVGANQVGGGGFQPVLNGHPVYGSTQIPTDRVKGAGTDLTLLLAGVPSEWLIGRAGVIDFDMTNSDGTKFQQRINTLRGTQYVDAGPAHDNAFGFIDDLLNS